VVVEVKAVEALAPIHRTQLRMYLRLAECPVGLILNFNVPLLKHGIRRVVNKRCRTAAELAMLGSASDDELPQKRSWYVKSEESGYGARTRLKV
jgi:PD-(D/E)XK nuclease superfamily